ncbi:AaceriADR109Wp [[Ashbya] aceris (nom. inval.)]|nr:AaceriADR109Wp [[Ashbya] aceris (nom. inval.)]
MLSAARTELRKSSLRLGSMARFYSPEGSTGAPRGESADDAFVKREKANEDYYIRKHEREQLAQLREQLQKQQKKIDNLEEQLRK